MDAIRQLLINLLAIVVVFLFLVTFLIPRRGASAQEKTESQTRTVELSLEDQTPYHVHPPGTDFTVHLTSPVKVWYSWKDWRGRSLTERRMLEASERHNISSPHQPDVGYYGLAVEPVDPNVALSRAEYGFAVLPSPTQGNRTPNPSLPFGTIHTDINDPYLIGWTKTATLHHGWNEESSRLNADYWRSLIAEREDMGLLELPLFADDTWWSDPTKPISEEKLDAIGRKLKQYLQATPNVLFWELGSEENLRWRRHRDEWKRYWSNLARKFQVARRAADEVNPEIRFLYQIAERDFRSIEDFARSEAAKHVDILSLHPYAWPDFPSPEGWMPEYLDRTRRLLRDNSVEMPIWYTEIGAPHHGNPGGFFGYPDRNIQTSGKTRDEVVTYMIKCHVMALHLGVEKVFWYNYRDRGNRPTMRSTILDSAISGGSPSPSTSPTST